MGSEPTRQLFWRLHVSELLEAEAIEFGTAAGEIGAATIADASNHYATDTIDFSLQFLGEQIHAATEDILSVSADFVEHTTQTKAHGVGEILGSTETQEISNKTITNSTVSVDHGDLTGLNDSDDHSSLYASLLPTTSNRNVIIPDNSGIIPFVVKGAASQSADLLQIRNNSNDELFSVENNGFSVFDVGIRIGTTSDTTNGNLRFTGSDFEGRTGGVWKSLTAGADSGSSTDVVRSSTPSSNQVTFWTSNSAVSGDDQFTYNPTSDELTLDGTQSISGQLQSSLLNDSPFTVQSNTLVNNLNADLLDGLHANEISGDNEVIDVGGAQTVSYSHDAGQYPNIHFRDTSDDFNFIPPSGKSTGTTTFQFEFAFAPDEGQYTAVFIEPDEIVTGGNGSATDVVFAHSQNTENLKVDLYRASDGEFLALKSPTINSATYFTYHFDSSAPALNDLKAAIKVLDSSFTLGDGSTNPITKSPNDETREYIWSIRRAGSGNKQIWAGISAPTIDDVSTEFGFTPTSNEFTFYYQSIKTFGSQDFDNFLRTDLSNNLISGTLANSNVTGVFGNLHADVLNVTNSITANLVSASDFTGITLDDVGDPEGSNTINFGNNDITFRFPNTGRLLFDVTGGFTGSALQFSQTTGNPGQGTHLLEIDAEDEDVIAAEIENFHANGIALDIGAGRIQWHDAVASLIDPPTQWLTLNNDDFQIYDARDLFYTEDETDSLIESATLGHYSSSDFDTDFSGKTTSDLSEGSNLYFTNERAQDAVGITLNDTSTVDLGYNDGSAQITASVLDVFVSNTTDRMSGSLTVDGTAAVGGVLFATDVQASTFTGDGSLLTGLQTNNLIESSTNLFFTGARVLSSIGVLQDASVADDITLTNITQITSRSHTNLNDVGSNTHAQIDSHINEALTTSSTIADASLATLSVDISDETNLSVGTGLTLSGDQILLDDTVDNTDDSVSEDEIDDTFSSTGFWFYDHNTDTVSTTQTIDISAYTNLTAGNQLTLSGDTLNVSEGSGSGLDADTLDGQESSFYSQDNTRSDEEIRDVIAGFATAGSNMSITHDDPNNTLTFDVSDNWVNESGDTMSGALDMGSNNLTNINQLSVNSFATFGAQVDIGGNGLTGVSTLQASVIEDDSDSQIDFNDTIWINTGSLDSEQNVRADSDNNGSGVFQHGGSSGVSGTFEDNTGKTITVSGGIITNIP